MAVFSLAVASPLLFFFIRYPFYFIFRVAFVSNRGVGVVAGRPWLTWINNIGRVVRGLFWWGEANVHQNLPGRPFLDLVQAALFTLGSWVSLRRWRQPERIFLLLWLLVMLLPSVLSGDAPHFGRLSGAAPVIALLAGLGADWFIARALRWQLVGGERPAFASKASFGRLGTALVPVLLVISIAWTARDYFLKYAQHPDLGTSFYLSDWQLGQYAAAQPADANLYLTPTQAEMATIMFALADAGRLASYDGSNGLIPTGSPSSSSLYLVGEGEQASLNALSTYFPEGQSGSLQAGYVPFHVHPDAHRTPMQYTVDFIWDGKIRLVGWSQHQSEGQLVITFAWRAESRMEEDYTAYVHLLDQRDVLSTQLDRPPAGYPTSAWRPGEVIIDHYTLLLPPDLPSGEYQVQTGWYMYPSLDELGSPASLNELFIQN
jgi:hypothetical protein